MTIARKEPRPALFNLIARFQVLNGAHSWLNLVSR